MAVRAIRTHQNRFQPGSAPDPAGGAHNAPPDPLVGWGGDTPSPYPTPLGASILRTYRHFFLSTSSTGCNNMHIDLQQPTDIITLNVTMHLALYTFSALLSLTEFPFTLDFPTFPAPCTLYSAFYTLFLQTSSC